MSKWQVNEEIVKEGEQYSGLFTRYPPISFYTFLKANQ